VDALNQVYGTDNANVTANTSDLYARGGNIGDRSGHNDLKIDSQHYATGGTIGARADQSLYLTETSGDARVVLLQAAGPDHSPALRFTVRESAAGPNLLTRAPGEALTLLPSVFVLFLENMVETVAHGLINAVRGSILLRVGDNVTTDPNAQILAGRNIDIYGDFQRVNELSGGVPVTDPGDPGYGTVVHLRGTVAHGGGYVARVFGNADVDQFYFDQTFLGGLNPLVPGGPNQVIPYNGGALATAYP